MAVAIGNCPDTQSAQSCLHAHCVMYQIRCTIVVHIAFTNGYGSRPFAYKGGLFVCVCVFLLLFLLLCVFLFQHVVRTRAQHCNRWLRVHDMRARLRAMHARARVRTAPTTAMPIITRIIVPRHLTWRRAASRDAPQFAFGSSPRSVRLHRARPGGRRGAASRPRGGGTAGRRTRSRVQTSTKT